jgi:hypothetical protein
MKTAIMLAACILAVAVMALRADTLERRKRIYD